MERINSHFATSISLFTLYLILCGLNQVVCEVYYIKSNASDLCTLPSCLTLSQFTANLSQHSTSNTTLIFLPGKHILTNNISVLSGHRFSMTSNSCTAQFECVNSFFSFELIIAVHITNLDFVGCGSNTLENVGELLIEDKSFEGQKDSQTALELININAKIMNCTFITNENGKLKYYYWFKSSAFVGGAIIATNSSIDVSQCNFESNGAQIGGAIFAEHSKLTVNNSIFNYAQATVGGAIAQVQSSITISNSELHSSVADRGGLLYSYSSNLTIHNSKLHNNTANLFGGTLASYNSNVTMYNCQLYSNSAIQNSGALYIYNSNVIISHTELHNNTASSGGAMGSYSSNLTIGNCELSSNTAIYNGGALYLHHSTFTVKDATFTNSVSLRGAILDALHSDLKSYGFLLIANNSANGFGILHLEDSHGQIFGNLEYLNNFGSIASFNSNISLLGDSVLANNTKVYTTTYSYIYKEGGALPLLEGNLIIAGSCIFKHNHAENGGGLHLTHIRVYVYGNLTVTYNTATKNGGGFYLFQSELYCQREGTIHLLGNTAARKGGGVHASSSTLTIAGLDSYSVVNSSIAESFSSLNVTNNSASEGGGLSLQAYSKLYVFRSMRYEQKAFDVLFTGNTANYGGAVYVDDESNSDACSDKSMECFVQILAHHIVTGAHGYFYDVGISFNLNTALVSGSVLFGGLLDRCIVSPFADVQTQFDPTSIYSKGGADYFKDITTEVTLNSTSSRPTQVCLCSKYHPNCSHQQQYPILVKKGQIFRVTLIGVDQAGHPVDATIQSSLNFSESGLEEGQLTRKIPSQCTALSFSIVSRHDTEKLTLYASDGPCKDADLSKRTIEIKFLPCECPISFQPSLISQTNCTCVCHSNISSYVDKCDIKSESFIRQSSSNIWICYNSTSGYVVYPNCPFDYCKPLSEQTPVNLNKPNGADSQCNFNRSELLCGSCQPGLSLSLGSSRCLSCHSHWPALLISITIAAIICGLALVSLLLLLNMNVAVGTLNGLIFYANIVQANKTIFFHFQKQIFSPFLCLG